MKKIYLLLISMLSIGVANAQFDVTFQVNMTNEIVTDLGAHVAGNWQDEDGGGSEWTPGDSPMVDNGDGTWSLTVSGIPAGTYEYKFLRSDFWNDGNGTDFGENPFNVCGLNTNRSFTVVDADVVLPVYCFNRCLPCGNNALKFSVAESPSTDMGLGGSFTEFPFVDIISLPNLSSSGIYDGIVSIPNFDTNEEIQYRFYDNAASEYESVVGDCLNADDNRTYTFPLVDGLPSGDFIVPTYIWGTCTQLAVDVTVKVDMSNYELCFGQIISDTVNLTGPLGAGWGSTTIMNDADDDGIYEVTISKTPSSTAYEYKFRVNGSYEGGTNRNVIVIAGEPLTIEPNCFGSSELGVCVPNPLAPSVITFQVDPIVQVPADEKLWIFGDFTFRTFQQGAIEMTDANADGIWESDQLICNNTALYKFAIGDEYNPNDSTTTWMEEDADFSSIGGCGVDNGTYSDNRSITRTNTDPFTVCYTFNTCDNCVSGLNENTLTNTISIYPNPFSTQTLISVENKEGVALSMNVLDITGKEVKALTNLANNTITIDNRGMSSGMYFLQIFNNNGQKAVKKLIVQ